MYVGRGGERYRVKKHVHRRILEGIDGSISREKNKQMFSLYQLRIDGLALTVDCRTLKIHACWCELADIGASQSINHACM